MTAEHGAPGGTVATATPPARTREEASLRERLGEFRALLVISLLMTESVNEDQILELAASSAPGLGPWRIEGYGFTDGQWRPGQGTGHAPAVTGDLSGQLATLGSRRGKVNLPRRGWARAYPPPGVSGPPGHLGAAC